MGTAAIIILVLCVLLIINNTAGEYVRIDDRRRQQETMYDIQETARIAKEKEQIQRQNEETKQYLIALEKRKFDKNPDYITDAEIIED